MDLSDSSQSDIRSFIHEESFRILKAGGKSRRAVVRNFFHSHSELGATPTQNHRLSSQHVILEELGFDTQVTNSLSYIVPPMDLGVLDVKKCDDKMPTPKNEKKEPKNTDFGLLKILKKKSNRNISPQSRRKGKFLAKDINGINILKTATFVDEDNIANINQFSYQGFITKILKIPPDKRNSNNIEMLLNATSYLDFFNKMQKKTIDIEQQTQLKCCKVLKHASYKKGQTIIKYNDFPDRAFIQQAGTVAVYKPKLLEELHNEKKILRKLSSMMNSDTFNDFQIKEMLDTMDEETQIKTFRLTGLKLIAGITKYIEGKVTWKSAYLNKWLNFNHKTLLDGSDLFDNKTALFKYNFQCNITKGNVFGEKGFQDNTKRQASIVCSTDCEMGYLGAQEYKAILDSALQVKLSKKKKFFTEKVFKNDGFLRYADKIPYMWLSVKFQKGDYLYHEGDLIKTVFVIRKGLCKLFKKTVSELVNEKKSNLQDAKSLLRTSKRTFVTEIGTLGPGEFVGELYNFEVIDDNEQRDHSALCLDSVSCYRIDKDVWVKVQRDIPEMYKIVQKRNFERNLSRKHRSDVSGEICRIKNNLNDDTEFQNATSKIIEEKKEQAKNVMKNLNLMSYMLVSNDEGLFQKKQSNYMFSNILSDIYDQKNHEKSNNKGSSKKPLDSTENTDSKIIITDIIANTFLKHLKLTPSSENSENSKFVNQLKIQVRKVIEEKGSEDLKDIPNSKLFANLTKQIQKSDSNKSSSITKNNKFIKNGIASLTKKLFEKDENVNNSPGNTKRNKTICESKTEISPERTSIFPFDSKFLKTSQRKSSYFALQKEYKEKSMEETNPNKLSLFGLVRGADKGNNSHTKEPYKNNNIISLNSFISTEKMNTKNFNKLPSSKFVTKKKIKSTINKKGSETSEHFSQRQLKKNTCVSSKIQFRTDIDHKEKNSHKLSENNSNRSCFAPNTANNESNKNIEKYLRVDSKKQEIIENQNFTSMIKKNNNDQQKRKIRSSQESIKILNDMEQNEKQGVQIENLSSESNNFCQMDKHKTLDKTHKTDHDFLKVFANMCENNDNLFEDLVIKSSNPQNKKARKVQKAIYRLTHPTSKKMDWYSANVDNEKNPLTKLKNFFQEEIKKRGSHDIFTDDLQKFDESDVKKNLKYILRDYSKKDNTYLLNLRKNPKQPQRIEKFKEKFLKRKKPSLNKTTIQSENCDQILAFQKNLEEETIDPSTKYLNQGSVKNNETVDNKYDRLVKRISYWDNKNIYNPLMSINSIKTKEIPIEDSRRKNAKSKIFKPFKNKLDFSTLNMTKIENERVSSQVHHSRPKTSDLRLSGYARGNNSINVSERKPQSGNFFLTNDFNQSTHNVEKSIQNSSTFIPQKNSNEPNIDNYKTQQNFTRIINKTYTDDFRTNNSVCGFKNSIIKITNKNKDKTEENINGFNKSNQYNPDTIECPINSFQKNNYLLTSSYRINRCINKRGFVMNSSKRSESTSPENELSIDKFEQESTDVGFNSCDQRKKCLNDINKNLDFFIGDNRQNSKKRHIKKYKFNSGFDFPMHNFYDSEKGSKNVRPNSFAPRSKNNTFIQNNLSFYENQSTDKNYINNKILTKGLF